MFRANLRAHIAFQVAEVGRGLCRAEIGPGWRCGGAKIRAADETIAVVVVAHGPARQRSGGIGIGVDHHLQLPHRIPDEITDVHDVAARRVDLRQVTHCIERESGGEIEPAGVGRHGLRHQTIAGVVAERGHEILRRRHAFSSLRGQAYRAVRRGERRVDHIDLGTRCDRERTGQRCVESVFDTRKQTGRGIPGIALNVVARVGLEHRLVADLRVRAWKYRSPFPIGRRRHDIRQSARWFRVPGRAQQVRAHVVDIGLGVALRIGFGQEPLGVVVGHRRRVVERIDRRHCTVATIEYREPGIPEGHVHFAPLPVFAPVGRGGPIDRGPTHAIGGRRHVKETVVGEGSIRVARLSRRVHSPQAIVVSEKDRWVGRIRAWIVGVVESRSVRLRRSQVGARVQRVQRPRLGNAAACIAPLEDRTAIRLEADRAVVLIVDTGQDDSAAGHRREGPA